MATDERMSEDGHSLIDEAEYAVRRTQSPPRIARYRIVLGIVAILVGGLLFALSLPIALLLNTGGYAYDIISPAISKLGLVVAGAGAVAPVLLNYLQFGAALPSSSLIHPPDMALLHFSGHGQSDLPSAVDTLAADVEQRLGGVDILINNAGRSVRRPLIESLERCHDVERTMALNYY